MFSNWKNDSWQEKLGDLLAFVIGWAVGLYMLGLTLFLIIWAAWDIFWGKM